MSLGTSIRAALAPTITMLTREFGQTAVVRQQAEYAEADGSTSLLDRKAPGFNDPITVILSPISRHQAQRDWGQETEVEVEGLISAAIELTPDYRLVVESGALAGAVLMVVDRKPDDVGGIVVLGLKAVA